MDWREAARRFASEVDFSQVSVRIREAIEGRTDLFVACSGGADSVYATLWCWLYRENCDKDLRVTCLHLNHVLRGEEADGDESFVRELCDGLGIACVAQRASWSKPVNEVTEADARSARLDFFERVAIDSGAERISIATGHHSGDIAETMLMRLSRGSDLQGLCAPREISQPSPRIRFLRPLLELGREEIHAALTRSGIEWREDGTNTGEAFYRNRLRHSAIPAWEEAADRAIGPGIQRSRRLLEEDWRALESLADELFAAVWNEEKRSLERDKLQAAPVALQRRALQKFACRVGFDGGLPAAILEPALRCLAAGSRVSLNLSANHRLTIDSNYVACEAIPSMGSARNWREFALPVGCSAFLPDGASVGIEIIAVSPAIAENIALRRNDDSRSVFISPKQKQNFRVIVRSRRPGDAFKPHGKSSLKKVKTLLIDKKIRVEERDRLPVFAMETGEIVWVPGLPPSADWLLERGSETALRLTYVR